jgi:hypothetical protein
MVEEVIQMIGEIQEHCQIESSNPDFTDENREKV